MRNIKRKITKEYHEIKLKELKDQIGINEEIVYVKKRSKWLIPSIASFATSFVVILVVFLSIINMKAYAPNDTTNEGEFDGLLPNENGDSNVVLTNEAIENLKENTNDYIAVPIKILVDSENDLIISVYYGVKEDDFNQHSHYLVILYESTTSLLLDTKVTSLSKDAPEAGEGNVDAEEDGVETEDSPVNAPLIFDQSFLLNGNEIQHFIPDDADITIYFSVGDNNHSLDLNLDKYYDWLFN